MWLYLQSISLFYTPGQSTWTQLWHLTGELYVIYLKQKFKNKSKNKTKLKISQGTLKYSFLICLLRLLSSFCQIIGWDSGHCCSTIWSFWFSNGFNDKSSFLNQANDNKIVYVLLMLFALTCHARGDNGEFPSSAETLKH